MPLQIQTKLSKEQQTFLPYFFLNFGIYIKLPMFWKPHERHWSNISEVIDSERYAYLNA